MAKRRSHRKYHRKSKIEKYVPLLVLVGVGVVVAVAYKGGKSKVLMSSEMPPDVLPTPQIAYKMSTTPTRTNPAIGVNVAS
jgi:hypothetical protein